MSPESTPIEISSDPSRICTDAVERLLRTTYWAAERSREAIERSLRHSLVYGAYRGLEQVAFARVVTDFSTFAWVCDVVVDAGCRGCGISKRLMAAILEDPQLEGVRILLATRDAHGLYEQFGFSRFDDDRFLGRGFSPFAAPSEEGGAK